MNRPRRPSMRVVAAALGAGILAGSLLTSVPGSAAGLHVDGGVAHYWEFDVVTVEEPTGPPPTPAECAGMSFDNVIVGTDGPDHWDLTPPEQVSQRNLVFGLGGDDIIRGGNQDDCLVGGDGADQLFGENGSDVLIGGNGGDHLDGGNGGDRLYGDGGDDVLHGGNGSDTLSGGDGEDRCAGGHAADTVLDGCEVVED